MNKAPRPAAKRGGFPLISVILAALLGAAVDIAVAETTGARESWDTPGYAVFVLPALGVIAAAFAWINPRRSVICGAAAVVGQFLAMALRSEDIGSMLPLGALFTIPVLAGVALIGLFVGRLRKEAVHDHDQEAEEHADLDQ
jgi:hypothetical protein